MCSTGYPDRHGPVTLGRQYGPRWRPRPQVSAGSPVMIEATDINAGPFQMLQDPGPRPGPCHSPGPDISWDSGGQMAIQVSLFFSTSNFPDSSLPSPQTISPLQLFPLPTLYFLRIMVPNHLVLGLLGSCLGHRKCLVEYCLPQPWACLCSLSLAQASPTDSGPGGAVALAWVWTPQTPK